MEDTAAAPQPPEAAPKSAAADALAARREARRKRILENSNNRLTKITGREHNEPPAEDFTVSPPETIYPDPEDERDVYQQPAAAAAALASPNGDIFSLLNTLNQANANGSVPGQPPPPTATSLAPDTALVKFLRTRLHIALMAIGVYLAFATGHQNWLGGSVFVALLAWETAELCLLQPFPGAQQPSFLDVVFLLSGLNSRSGQFVMRIVRTTHRVLRDVALFMFCFVVSHLLWSCLVLDIDLAYVLNYHQLEAEAPEGTAVVA